MRTSSVDAGRRRTPASVPSTTEATTRAPEPRLPGTRRASGETEPSLTRSVALSRSIRRIAALLASLTLLLTSIPAPVTAVDPIGGGAQPARLDRPPLGGRSTNAGDAFLMPDFVDEVVLDGLDWPVTLDFADDGRVFVAEKSGAIKVFDSLADPTPSTWADIGTKVHDFWDRGLLGMALDPDFSTNGRLYVAYTFNAQIGGTAPVWPDDTCPNPPEQLTDGCVVSGRVSALTSGGGEQVLVSDWCQQFPSHSMSGIVFDADGALIVGGGDGASFDVADWGQFGGSLPNTPTPRNPCGDPPGGVGGVMNSPTAEGGALRAQDLRGTTYGDPVGLNGSVIRIDPATGAAMPDNPTTSGSANERRIIAYGLRNPFRMAINPADGALWMADVGWSDWEEVDRLGVPTDAVRNFGWPCREGMGPVSDYSPLDLCNSLSDWTDPVFVYSHADEAVPGDGCGTGGAIAGMAFYEGGSYPALYDGALFFADYARGCAWVMPLGEDGQPDPTATMHFGDLSFPVDLVVGPDGDLFYPDLIDGEIHRIRYQGPNEVPDAQVTAAPTWGLSPLKVNFNASGSSDPDEDALTYAWDFGDGDGAFNDATGATPSHTYASGGTYTARVRVSDGRGGTDTAQVVLRVANGFTDVAPGSIFRGDIGWLAVNGITTGCAPALFCPASPVTRAQIASFLVRSLGLTAGGSPDLFTDIAGTVHRADINRLATAGITSGCTTATFCPERVVTRAEMASFLARALGLTGSAPDAFTDDGGSIHEHNINLIAQAGITTGCTPTTFCPDASVTREQMAAFLHRAFAGRFPG